MGSAICAFGVFLHKFLKASFLPLAAFYRALFLDTEVEPGCGCSRNLFPLPRIVVWPSDLECEANQLDAHLCCANLCIAGLNFLEQGMPKRASSAPMPRRCSAAQASVHRHVAGRTQRFLGRLEHCWGSEFAWAGAFQRFEQQSGCRYEKVRADAVDLPERAGACDPSSLVPRELWELVSDPTNIFHGDADASTCKEPQGQERWEYLKLTARELICGKLRLRPRVQGQAGVFAAPKKTCDRQRKIWDGSLLSKQAETPPAPCRLANPSSFLDLLLRPGEVFYMSKRDASTYFDSLRVPHRLQEWFGQAPVTVGELLSVGLSRKQIMDFTDGLPVKALLPAAVLHPVNVVWPMGFSWSPCVAQSSSVGCVLKAGVPEHQILSLEHDVPQDQSELCAVCMDDLLFFHKKPRKAQATLQRLDSVFQRHGIQKNAAKDVSLASSMTGLGCDISNSPAVVEPNQAKLANMVLSLCDVLCQEQASPRAMTSALGVLQWFCLLQRGMLSIFDEVYAFTARGDPDSVQPLPCCVQGELFTALALAPLLAAGLDRQFLDELLACDAAPEFGFGVSSLSCGRKTVERVGRLAERRGDYVRLVAELGDGPEVPRLGSPHRLPFRKSHFRTLISCAARKQAHSGLLECHGVLLALKWVARSAKRHHRRPVVLVDAKAAIGSISKGRSSARALRRVLRSTAAVCLASDLLPRLVYIPSESNPADAPSRGKSGRGLRLVGFVVDEF
ncbi:hypothetical protein AK812_SmicGene15416 [Symbiodinium microadriaticum]|nr:hypothetical protein AK812_SmicGene15416 [Symbiodinium microadriaticum]